MHVFRTLALMGLALFALAGCTPASFLPPPLQSLINTYGAITDTSVPAKTVIVAANAFDAVEATAKNVLVACTPTARPAACNDASLRSLIRAVKAGRDARDGLEGFLAAHPGQLGSKGLYDALTAATATITEAITDYNGGAS